MAEARRQGGDVRRRIRPPLTPHRHDDRPVELLAPDTAEQACRALEPPGQQLDGLPASPVRLLRARTPQTPDGTRSATLYAATRRLASRGLAADEAVAIIQAGGGIAAGKLAERGHDWWHRYVWAPAADAPRVRGDADPAIDQAIGELLGAAQQQAWRGRGDRVAYEVLLALAALASVQATLRVEASIRTLILATGHSFNGIRDALAALQDAGWGQRQRVGGTRWQERTSWAPSGVRRAVGGGWCWQGLGVGVGGGEMVSSMTVGEGRGGWAGVVDGEPSDRPGLEGRPPAPWGCRGQSTLGGVSAPRRSAAKRSTEMHLGKPRKLVQAAAADPAAERAASEPIVAADPVERVVVVHEPHVPDRVETDTDVALWA